MSNWCNNTLTLVGEREEVYRFIMANGDPLALHPDAQRLTFRALIHIRRHVNGLPHWGVPRDAMDVDEWDVSEFTQAGTLYATCAFATDATPPRLWFEAAARAYPTLQMTLTYDELDNFVAGQLRAEHGVVSNVLYEEELFESLAEEDL